MTHHIKSYVEIGAEKVYLMKRISLFLMVGIAKTLLFTNAHQSIISPLNKWDVEAT